MVNWDAPYETLNSFATFDQLEQFVENYEVRTFPCLVKPNLNARRPQRIDQVAKSSMPDDAAPGLVPISTIGDGNCFARSVSTALFGNQNHHKQIWICLVFEAVLNKDRYLSNDYLKNGATHIYG